MTTERDMLDALTRRYSSVRAGTIADRWVRAEHVRRTLGYSRQQRIADFISADQYPGMPYGSSLAFHWHEVKVTRSDWLRELADLSKSEAFTPFMHHRWLAVSDTSIVRDGELPESWGLLVLGGNGVLRARVKAPRHEPEPMPTDLIIALTNAAARTAHRAPLRGDAPSTWSEKGMRCGWCGEMSPCRHHQTRERAQGRRRHG